MQCGRLKGWMTDWHVQHNFTNPVHLNHFLPHAQRSASVLQSLLEFHDIQYQLLWQIV